MYPSKLIYFLPAALATIYSCSGNIQTTKQKVFFNRDSSAQHHLQIKKQVDESGILQKNINIAFAPWSMEITSDTVFSGKWKGTLSDISTNTYQTEFEFHIDARTHTVSGMYAVHTLPHRIAPSHDVEYPDDTVEIHNIAGYIHEDSLYFRFDTLYNTFLHELKKELRFRCTCITIDTPQNDDYPKSYLIGDFIDSSFTSFPLLGHILLCKEKNQN
ncbi:MAG TPA: hypothetical protein VEW28_03555 [Candidatus Kapabacteria bacterium]|nr:hypothetical protein [Candidatus Kapabacteria bacterium]